jgi:hypothetical protein
MYEKEKELLDALCTIKDPDVDKIKRLLAEPLDFAYLLGKLIYSGVHELAWHTICTHQLQGLINREIRNSLKLLSE